MINHKENSLFVRKQKARAVDILLTGERQTDVSGNIFSEKDGETLALFIINDEVVNAYILKDTMQTTLVKFTVEHLTTVVKEYYDAIFTTEEL